VYDISRKGKDGVQQEKLSFQKRRRTCNLSKIGTLLVQIATTMMVDGNALSLSNIFRSNSTRFDSFMTRENPLINKSHNF
jgi:hypothetical protein